MVNIFWKLQQRRKGVTAVLALLLTAATAFSCVGFAAWYACQQQLRAVGEQYTTIAIPRGDVPWTNIRQQQEKYPGWLGEDRRCLLGAYVEGCDSLSSYDLQEYGHTQLDLYGNNLAVLAVQCDNVQEITLPVPFPCKDEAGELRYADLERLDYTAEFTVLDMVCRLDSFLEHSPQTVYYSDSLRAPDGSIPFEAGKTYLLFGLCTGPMTFEDPQKTGASQWIFENPGYQQLVTNAESSSTDFPFGSIFEGEVLDQTRKTGNWLFSWNQTIENGTIYTTTIPGELPFYEAYTGTWQAFLDSEEGTVWRETIIPMCQRNYHSAAVLLTDNVDSLLRFNTGEAAIVEGRRLQGQDYANGEKVCLVSAAYAVKNDLQVGDVLDLDLYEAQSHPVSISIGLFGSHDWLLTQEHLQEKNRLDLRQSYTVVGIYTVPALDYGNHGIASDTIIVPKASVENAERYESESANVLLYSIILENGKEHEFEEKMQALGYGGAFEYFSQGYNALAETMEVTASNASRIFAVSIAVFLVAAALYLYLSMRRARPVIRSARLLGIGKMKTRKQAFAALSSISVCAMAAGTGVGALLYGQVTQRLLSASLKFPAAQTLLWSVGLLVMLTAGSWLWTVSAAGKPLMQKGRE